MTENTAVIRKRLLEYSDLTYRDFQSKLIPTIKKESVIGVKTPILKNMAKEMIKNGESKAFLRDLPHIYLEENQLHAFIIARITDYEECMKELKRFLPYINNWATCDQLLPEVFKKEKKKLLEEIAIWLESGETYTIRFAIGMLMKHFLEEDFDLAYPKKIAKISSQEYYVNMMIAWYFATALSKQYESILPFILEGELSVWTHNKTIQKAIESDRITAEQKEYLRTLKRKTSGNSA